VRQVARQLGYVANVHACTLASGTTSTVGLIVHEIGDPYFAEIASGVLRVADTQDLMVQICYTGPALQVEAKAELAAFQASGGWR